MKSNLLPLHSLPVNLSANPLANFLASLAIILPIYTASSPATAQATEDESTGSEASDSARTSSSHLDLSSNDCLKQLDDTDIVIASMAFVDGLNGFAQLKELVARRPWGVGTPDTADEIKSQMETQSPFLIISLTKAQVLTLDDHRDIIKWVLVQSTSQVCG